MWTAAAPICAFFFCLQAAAQPAAPMRCTLAAQGDAAVLLKGVSVSMPASLADCQDARVVRGQVIACQGDAQGLPVCRSFNLGEAIHAGPFGNTAPGAPLAGLDRLLRASPGTMPGPLRGAETLLPTKVVLLLDGRLLVDFSEVDMQGVETVEIHRDSVDGPLVERIVRTSGPAAISVASMLEDSYYWTVLVPGDRPNQTPRRFSIATSQERQAIRDKLRVFDRQQAGPLATAMMRAAWLAQENYDYDALATMKAVGMRTR